MGFFDIFKSKFDEELKQIRLDNEREKLETKREFERRKQDIELKTRERREQLEQTILDYKIKDQETRILEEFGDEEPELQEENSPINNMLMGVAQKFLNPAQQAPPLNNSPPFTPPQQPALVDFTEEEIKAMIAEVPKQYLKMAKFMTDEQIADFIRGKYKNISEDSIKRGISTFRKI